MKIIGIGSVSKYSLIPFLAPIFYISRDILFKYLHALEFLNYSFLEILIMFLSESLCILFEIYVQICSRKIDASKNVERKNLKARAQSRHSSIYIIEKRKKYTIVTLSRILLSSFIDFACYTTISYLCSNPSIQRKNIHTEMRIVPLFFNIILSWKFLHLSLFFHHKVSILIIIFGFLMICVNRFYGSVELLKFIPVFIAIHFFYSIKQINDKHLMDKVFISPFVLLGLEGLFGIILSIFALVIVYYIPCPGWLYCKEKNIEHLEFLGNIPEEFSEKPNILGFLFLLLFSSSGLNLLLTLTNKFFSPIHRSISDTLNAFFCWIMLFILKDGWTFQKSFDLIAYLIIAFGCLIFNEIIIIYCMEMTIDLKTTIIEREKRDTLETYEEVRLSPLIEGVNDAEKQS